EEQNGPDYCWDFVLSRQSKLHYFAAIKAFSRISRLQCGQFAPDPSVTECSGGAVGTPPFGVHIANFAIHLSRYCERRIRNRFDHRSVQANPPLATPRLQHETHGL